MPAKGKQLREIGLASADNNTLVGRTSACDRQVASARDSSKCRRMLVMIELELKHALNVVGSQVRHAYERKPFVYVDFY